MIESEYDIGDIFFNKDKTVIGIIIKKEFISRANFSLKHDFEIEVWKYTVSFLGKAGQWIDIKPPCTKILSTNQVNSKLSSGAWYLQRRYVCT